MEWEKQTLGYYEQNSEGFISGTLAADMTDTQQRFAACLPEGGVVLDFGCGSGRDTKAFLEMGFMVDATDGSGELCAKASAYTGIQVRQLLFKELDAADVYDGIWACASILHLPRPELLDVLGKISKALKAGGVLYASFKYGDFEGMRNGRHFTDFTEQSLEEFWKDVPCLKIFDLWVTKDVRADREDEKWINFLARKNEVANG